MDSLLKDLRYTLRGLLRAPAFTLPVVVTLALGLGANAAVVSVVVAVLMRPLPYQEAARLVRVYESCALSPASQDAGTNDLCAVSTLNLRDWRQQTRGLSGFAAYNYQSMSLQRMGEADRLRGLATSPELFSTLGVPPLLGRPLRASDGSPSEPAGVVLSHRLWQRRFAGDRQILGRTLWLDNNVYTVVGVMPAAFDFPPAWEVDLWVPLRTPPAMQDRGNHWLSVVARLGKSTSLDAAQAEMSGIAARIAAAFPDEQEGRGARVIPLREDVVGAVRPRLMVVASAAVLVLLIACANATSLMLARSIHRRRELGVRAALGASGWRLGRQVALEALAVALAGTVAALGLAQVAVAGLMRLAGDWVLLPSGAASVLDPRAFLFIGATALLAALGASAVLPAWRAPAGRLVSQLHAGGARAGHGTGTRRLRAALVVGQVALSAVLLVGTGLLLRTLATLLGTPTGMAVEHSVAFSVAVPRDVSGRVVAGFFPRILDRVGALPGIDAAGWTSHLPLRQWGTNSHFSIEGIPAAPTPEEAPFAELRFVSPGFFSALGIPLLRGRNLRPEDGDPGAPGVLVNQALVDRYIADSEPLRRHMGVDPVGTMPGGVAIVGVVGDIHEATLDRAPTPTVYFSTELGVPEYITSMSLVVRSSLPTATAVRSVRGAVQQIAPGQAVFNVLTMPEVVAESVGDRRLVMWLLATFGVVALLLSAAGLYGLLAYLVAQGRREIGIRMALGAARQAVLRLVLGEGARLLALGLAIGLVLSLASSRLLGGLLYGVAATDPLVLLVVVGCLVGVSLLALWMPVRRALRIDPAHVLREDE